MHEQDAIQDILLNRIYSGELELREDCGARDWYIGLWTHVQRSNSRPLRDVMKSILAQHVRWYTKEFDTPNADVDADTQNKVNELRDQGYAWLQLPTETIESIVAALQGVCFHGADSDEKFYFDPDLSTTRTTSFSTAIAAPRANVLDYPDIVRLAGNKHVLGIVREFLGALPRLSGMSLTLNQAGRQGRIPSSNWHYDKGPIGAVKMFVYLNDMTPRTGPHAFVTGSQETKLVEEAVTRRYPRDPETARGLFHSQRWSADEMDAVFPDRQIIHTGPAGLAILEDTRGFHRATHVETGHRLMLTLEWALDSAPTGRIPERVPFDSLPRGIRPTSDLAERRFRYIFDDFLA